MKYELQLFSFFTFTFHFLFFFTWVKEKIRVYIDSEDTGDSIVRKGLLPIRKYLAHSGFWLQHSCMLKEEK